MTNENRTAPHFIGTGSPMRDLVATFDWAATSLGPLSGWSPALKTAVSIVLNSAEPMVLWWGPDFVQVYNDAFVPTIQGGKHPTALGQAAALSWTETWDMIGSEVHRCYAQGVAFRHEDAFLPILRNGRLEKAYWTYSYTPVFGTSEGIEGILVICAETTAAVLKKRRDAVLARLNDSLASCVTEDEVKTVVLRVLNACPEDIASVAIASPGQPAASAPATRKLPIAPAVRDLEIDVVLASPDAFDAGCDILLAQVGDAVSNAVLRARAAQEEALAAADRDRLLMGAPVGTAVFVGDDLTVKWANQAYCEIIDQYEIDGKTFDEVFPELKGTPLGNVFRTVYRTGVPVTSKETHAQIRLKGELQDRYYTYNLVPLRSAAGGIYGLWVIVVDITEQVVSRKETERLNEELNVAARAKDEFLALLGHELRNPLAPIVTALQLMRLRSAEIGREQLIMERQVEHLVRLVDDLLDVSKITRGLIELRMEVVNLVQVMQKAVEMAEYLLDRKAHHLTVKVPDITWYGDPARLAQVVANLLTNAARYTPAGGRIDLSVEDAGSHVVISVSDNGAGISQQLMPNIFDSFVQGSRSSDRAEGGLGIGLSLVRNLVGMHGGEVSVESEGEGKGSKFIVSLPLQESADLPVAGAAPLSVAPTGKAQHILLVDDNRDAADTLAQILRTAGHRVNVAYEPFEAIAAFQALRPSLAILDIGLPGMDGYQLAGRLKATLPAVGCTLFSLSGYGQFQDEQRSLAAGFARHLVKPISADALLDAVNAVNAA